jgi:hypothetical protein
MKLNDVRTLFCWKTYNRASGNNLWFNYPMLDAEGNDIIMLVEKGAIYTYMIPPILL